MGEVNLPGREKLVCGDVVDGPSGCDILFDDILDLLLKRMLVALFPAENVVKNLCRRFIFIIVVYDGIAALTQIIDRRSRGGLERGDRILFLMAAPRPGKCLIFKYEKEPPRDRLAGAELPDQPQIVLLQHPAVRIGFPLQFLSHLLYMPVDVRTLRQNLELKFNRRNLQIADKGINDVALFLCAPQQKVDRNDLDDLDIAVIPCEDHAVHDLLDRDIGGQRVQRLHIVLRGEKNLVLLNLLGLQIKLKAVPAFRERIGLFCLFRHAVLPAPVWQKRTLSVTFICVPCQQSSVANELKQQPDESGETHATDADQSEQHQRERGQTKNDDARSERRVNMKDRHSYG